METRTYRSQAARDAAQSGYGGPDYPAYLDETAERHAAYWESRNQPYAARRMFTRSLGAALAGNDGE